MDRNMETSRRAPAPSPRERATPRSQISSQPSVVACCSESRRDVTLVQADPPKEQHTGPAVNSQLARWKVNIRWKAATTLWEHRLCTLMAWCPHLTIISLSLSRCVWLSQLWRMLSGRSTRHEITQWECRQTRFDITQPLFPVVVPFQ